MENNMFFFVAQPFFSFFFGGGVAKHETKLSEKIFSLIIVTIVYGFSRLLAAEDSVEKCTESSNAIAETRHLYKEKINSAIIVDDCREKNKNFARWWFQIFFIFIPSWGRFPFWLIFFRWVETTN